MNGKKFRNSLFGFNKSDVCEYIRSMDERVENKLRDKDREIAELKSEIAELSRHRETIVSVLQTAQQSAKSIVEDAQRDADELRRKTDSEVEEKKGLANREIEIKRREIKQYYSAENKKIEQIRFEVEKLRTASLNAIKRFETELTSIEKVAEQSAGYNETVMESPDFEKNVPKPFEGVERNIPIKTVIHGVSDEE